MNLLVPPTTGVTMPPATNPAANNALGAASPAPTAAQPNPIVDRGLLSYAHSPTPPTGSGTQQGGFTNVAPRADVSGLDPQFASKAQAFQQAAKAAGVDTTVLSGYRGTDLQSKLYANYQAKQAGRPLPYPTEGSGGIAAPPGQSYHNYGRAVDIAASTPAGQQWLISNAPKYGLYPGANFGDPPHFQDASWSPGGTGAGQAPMNLHQGPETSESGQSTSATKPTAPVAPTQPTAATPSITQPGAANNPNAYKLAMILSMFPQHKFSPVDYNPFNNEPRMRAPGATLD